MKEITGFTGLYFHSFNDDGTFQYQGLIERELPDGRLICLMYDWFMGDPNNQQTFWPSETDNWQFYTTAEHWVFNYERLKRKMDAKIKSQS